jgi:hypothetical protein
MNRAVRQTLLVTAAMASLVGFCATGQASAATTARTAVPAAAKCETGLNPGGADFEYTGGWVYCYDTTAAYRSKITCEDELRGSTGVYYGPYVKNGQNSFVDCPDSGGTQWIAVSITWQIK